jgi:hypothetical protein
MRANIHAQGKDDRITRQWLQCVQNNYQVHRWELKKALRLSLNDYYRYSSLIQWELGDYITYNKKSQMWVFDGPKAKEVVEHTEETNQEVSQ